MKRVTPSKSTTRREVLSSKDRVRGSLVTSRYWPWVLSWHESVAGIFGSPELLGVGPVDVVPGVALVSTSSGVWGEPGPSAPFVDGVGLGCVVGDVASALGVGPG